MEALMIITVNGEQIFCKEFQPKVDKDALSEFKMYVQRNPMNNSTKDCKHELYDHQFFYIVRNKLLWCFCLKKNESYIPVIGGQVYASLQGFYDLCLEKFGELDPVSIYLNLVTISVLAAENFIGGTLHDYGEVAVSKSMIQSSYKTC